MMSRKMWAPKGWEYGCGAGLVNTPPTSNVDLYVTPVLVTSAEGMPDFAPGDRVRVGRHEGSDVYEVDGMYVDGEGQWLVALWYEDGARWRCIKPSYLTKLPREVTKLVRVTGPEDAVGRVIYSLMDKIVRPPAYPEGVLVEIVEEER